MKCKSCETNFHGKVCPCGWRATNAQPTAKRSPCNACGEIHNASYLKKYNGQEICSGCLLLVQMKPEDRAYFQTLSTEYKFPVVDMPLHLLVANKLNMQLPVYLQTLPRNKQEYDAYWENRKINIGGI